MPDPAADQPLTYEQAVTNLHDMAAQTLPEDQRSPVRAAVALHKMLADVFAQNGGLQPGDKELLARVRDNVAETMYQRQTGRSLNAPPEELTPFEYLKRSAAAGEGRMLHGIGELFGSEESAQARREITQGEQIQDSTQGPAMRFAGGAASLGGRLLPALPVAIAGAAAAPAAAIAGPLALGLVSGASTAGSTYGTSRESGSSVGQAIARAGIMGATDTAVNVLLPGAGGRVGQTLIKGTQDSLLRETARSALEQGLGGAATSGIDSITRAALTDDKVSVGGAVLDALKSGGEGLLAGGVMHVGFVGAHNAVEAAKSAASSAAGAVDRSVAGFLPAAQTGADPRAAALRGDMAQTRAAAPPTVRPLDEALARAEQGAPGDSLAPDRIQSQVGPMVDQGVNQTAAGIDAATGSNLVAERKAAALRAQGVPEPAIRAQLESEAAAARYAAPERAPEPAPASTSVPEMVRAETPAKPAEAAPVSTDLTHPGEVTVTHPATGDPVKLPSFEEAIKTPAKVEPVTRGAGMTKDGTVAVDPALAKLDPEHMNALRVHEATESAVIDQLPKGMSDAEKYRLAHPVAEAREEAYLASKGKSPAEIKAFEHEFARPLREATKNRTAADVRPEQKPAGQPPAKEGTNGQAPIPAPETQPIGAAAARTPDQRGRPQDGAPAQQPAPQAVAGTKVYALAPGAKRATARPALSVVERVGGDRAVVSDGKGKFFVAKGEPKLQKMAAAKGADVPWHADLGTEHPSLEAARAEATKTASPEDSLAKKAPGPEAGPGDDSVRKWLASKEAPPELRQRWQEAQKIEDPADRAIAADEVLQDARAASLRPGAEPAKIGSQPVVDTAATARAKEAATQAARDAKLSGLASRSKEAIDAVSDLPPAEGRVRLKEIADGAAKSSDVGDVAFAKLFKRPEMKAMVDGPWEAATQDRILAAISSHAAMEGRLLPVPDGFKGAVADDGVKPEARRNLLAKMAEGLGLKVQWHPELTDGGRQVLGMHDGDTVHLSDKAASNIVDGVRTVSHEAIHSIIAGLEMPQKAALDAALAKILGGRSGQRVHDEVLRAWKGVLGENWMHESLADAGARAMLRDRGNLLALLPDAVAKPLRAALGRLGMAVKHLVQRLTGLKGTTPGMREELEDLAAGLFAAQRAKLSKDFVGPTSAMLEAAKILGPTPATRKVLDTVTGSLGGGFYKAGSVLGSKAGKLAQEGYLSLLTEAQSVSEKNPLFGKVWAHHFTAQDFGAAFHRRIAEHLEWVTDLSDAEASRLGKIATDLRIEQINRTKADQPTLTPDEARVHMRNALGASAEDVAKIDKIHEAMQEIWQEHERSLYDTAGVAWGTPEETRKLANDLEAAGGSKQRIQTIRQLADAAEELQSNAAASYVPLLRPEKGYSVIARELGADGVPGKTIDRRAASFWAQEKTINEMRAAHPEAHVTLEADALDPALPKGGALEDKIRAIAADAHADPQATDNFLSEVNEALVRQTFKAHLQHAEGVAGYETNLKNILPQYVGTAVNGIRKLKFRSLAREPLDAIAQSTDAGLKSFTTSWVHDVYQGQHGAAAQLAGTAKMIASATLLNSPKSGIVNLAGALAMNAPMIGIHSGKGSAAVTAYWQHLSTTAQLIPQVARDLMSGIGKLAGAGKQAQAILGKSSGLAQADRAASALRLTGQGETADALMQVARNSDVLIDPYNGEFMHLRQSAFNARAQKIAQGALYFQTITDRAARIATFTSVHQTAMGFEPKDWARVRRLGYRGDASPTAYAKYLTGKLNGHYGMAARPEEFRGPVASMAYQFGQYPMTVTKNLMSAWRAVAQDKGTDKAVGLGLLAAMGATFTAMGGAAALPFVGDVAKGAAATMNMLPSDMDPLHHKSLDQWMLDQAGDDKAARFMTYGLGAALPNDHGSWVTALGRASVPNTILGRLTQVEDVPSLAAVHNFVMSSIEGANALRTGNMAGVQRNAAAALGPWASKLEQLRHADTAGVVNRKGDTIVPADRLSTPEKVYMALGGTPQKAVEGREARDLKEELKRANQPFTHPLVVGFADALMNPNATEADRTVWLDKIQALQQKKLDAVENATTEEARNEARAELQGLTGPAIQAQVRQAYLERKFGLEAGGGRPRGPSFGLMQDIGRRSYLGPAIMNQ